MVSIIQLYKPNNTNYRANGDVVLTPTSALLETELNGVWELKLTHPIDDEGRWESVAEDAVIKVPSFMADDQLFVIRDKEKADSGITAVCEPVFMDSRNDVFLEDVRPTKKNGQQTLDIILAGTKYSGRSDILKLGTAYYEYMNVIEAINGDNDNSFINRWGGEILFDNHNIIINERVGGDYGVQLLYGKNIPADGLSEKIDMSEVCTRIYPKAYNGVKYNAGGKAYIDSPLIGKYRTVFARTVQYGHIKPAADANDGDYENSEIIICDTEAELMTALKAAAEADFESGIDKPKVTVNADMVLLQDTALYQDYAPLETVGLGDTIHCRHNRLGIVTDARVIKLTYDCIRKKVESVTLGDFEYNYFNNVSSSINTLSSRISGAIRDDGSLIAERVKGFINGAIASLTAQYNVAEKQDVQAILFENFDESSPMYGALGIGTQGLQISKTRTADGRAWDWTTAITAAGMIADTIVTGILASRVNPGENYWNLDTGELKITGDVNMTSGTIQLNGDVVVSGRLESKDGKNYWDFDTGDVELTGKFTVTDGGVQINTNDDSYNYIILKCKDTGLQSTQSAGQFTVQSNNLNGFATLQGHCVDINYPNCQLWMGFEPFTQGDNPWISLHNKKTNASVILDSDKIYWTNGNAEAFINSEGVTFQSPSGGAAMQPGRFICSDANGNITFDSNDVNAE